MIALAQWAMASRPKAYGTSIAFALGSMLVKPLGIIAGGLMTLVVLRVGIYQGVLLAASSSLVLGVASFFLLEHPWLQVAIYGVGFSIPVLLSSYIYVQRKNISMALVWVAGFHIAVLILVKLLWGDLTLFWEGQITNTVQLIKLPLNPEQVSILARMMNASIGMMVFFMGAFSFLLGCYWQAAREGHKEQESDFQSIRMSPLVATVGMAVFVLVWFNNHLAIDLSGVLLGLFVLQGLSLVHCFIQRRRKSAIWLYLFYGLMVFVPEMLLFMVMVSLTDVWLDLRKYIKYVEEQV